MCKRSPPSRSLDLRLLPLRWLHNCTFLPTPEHRHRRSRAAAGERTVALVLCCSSATGRPARSAISFLRLSVPLGGSVSVGGLVNW
ncbi:hypothetical protein GUJ93_ZPchr0006g43716 [Zizania palustris]|uniref:Uncharacterized protein n=1 Tax=Zizania palustris TaxID=103762 RepID=A0A8J5SKT1_ZIZPA|nr:hypothetical protein GUJ93_ZPchr0006g43716 [Zizania palustris]